MDPSEPFCCREDDRFHHLKGVYLYGGFPVAFGKPDISSIIHLQIPSIWYEQW